MRKVMIGAAVVLTILGFSAGIAYWRVRPGLVFLQRVADSSPEAEEAGEPIEEKEVAIAAGERTIPAMVYRPTTGYDRVILVLHGVHYGGYKESRLVPFSRKLAGMGYAVVTPDLADLRNYDICPRAVDDIEQAALWALDESGLVDEDSDGKIGIVGFSFSGGLGISAGSRESLRDRLAYILSFGGHGDLDRTMEYLVTSELPEGGELPAHVYGQVVLVKQFADRLVPTDQIQPLRDLALLYLHGEEDLVEERLDTLGPEARHLMQLGLDRDTATLGGILEPIVRSTPADPCLSPVRGTPPPCPLYFLHGSVDNVIPPSESKRLGDWASKSTESEVLISDLVVHVELDGEKSTSLADTWDLAVFLTRMLRT